MHVIAGVDLSDFRHDTAAPTDAAGACVDWDAADLARRLQRQGVGALQVAGIERDDAASPGQLLDLLDVIMAVNLPVQLRVPWRRAERIGDLLSRGACRVAVEVDANPEWVADLLERFGERVIPAVILAADRNPDLERRRLAGLGAMGAQRVLCVDEARRGTLAGPDLPLVRTLAGAGAPLIWEGGMGSAKDVRRLAACPGVEAVVLGRALRESRFTAAEARQWAGDEIQ